MKQYLDIGKKYDVMIKRDRYEVRIKIIVVGYSEDGNVLRFVTRKGGNIHEVASDCVFIY